MAKWGKRLLGLAAIGGAAAAGTFYYLKKKDMVNADDFEDDYEDEDFDLDSDLKPVSDREYVPLNSVSNEAVKEETPAGSAVESENSTEDNTEDNTEETEA